METTAFKSRHILVGFITLIVIGVLTAALFHWLLVYSLKDSEDQAYWVNLAGKQRMLSQALTVDTYRLLHYQHQETAHQEVHTQKIQQAQRNIDKNLQEFTKNITTLTSDAPLSDKHKQLYFAENLIEDLRIFAKQIEIYAADRSLEASFDYINSNTNQLLEKLDLAVFYQQQVGEQSIEKVNKLKNYIWIVFILMINFQIWLLLFPLNKRIAQLNKLAKKLKTQVGIDPLTGLFNRLYMEQEINNGLLKFQKDQTPFGILALDIDRFKLVNDEFGHHAGDLMLQQLTQHITSVLPKNALFYRSGGEEFVVYLPGCQLEDSFKIAEKIRTSVEKYEFDLGVIKLFKTISIGLNHTDNCTTNNAVIMLDNADKALYHSKNTGRNRTSVFDRSLL